ncbi:hypothetical protein QR305_00954 [Bacteroides finegoldii]|uniref:Uncharacterized protein n=1 Tax=Bacteroides finegoldii CL09T03C10 TaxID=997888 RepID=K5CKM4_9BACE|nr:hypothetical protein HMPREF1057_02736 [Bacteroides finegoldii CL09T03C10]
MEVPFFIIISPSESPTLKHKAPKVINSRGFITFITIMIYYSFRSFNSQANALAPSTAASESFSSETSNFVLPL